MFSTCKIHLTFLPLFSIQYQAAKKKRNPKINSLYICFFQVWKWKSGACFVFCSPSTLARSLSAATVIRKLLQRCNGQLILACSVHLFFSSQEIVSIVVEHQSSLSKYPLVILEILTFSLLEDVFFIRFLFLSPAFVHQCSSWLWMNSESQQSLEGKLKAVFTYPKALQ